MAEPSGVPSVEDVLAAHAPARGPISGSWKCSCGTQSIDGSMKTDDLTSKAERDAEWRTHLAGALASVLAEARAEGARQATKGCGGEGTCVLSRQAVIEERRPDESEDA